MGCLWLGTGTQAVIPVACYCHVPLISTVSVAWQRPEVSSKQTSSLPPAPCACVTQFAAQFCRRQCCDQEQQSAAIVPSFSQAVCWKLGLCLKSLSKGKILQSLFFFVCFSENKLKSSKYSIVNVVLFVLTVKKINDSSSLWQCWTPRSRLQDKMWCPATATNN